jgi:uncharacterized membrane protein YgcG
MTTARRFSLAVALVALPALSVAAYGCSSDTTTSTPDGGITTVAFDANLSVASPTDGACFPVPDGTDPMIPLTVAFKTQSGAPAAVYLRAAGFCTTLPNAVCGHLVVKVDGVVNNEGGTPTVNVLLRKFATPYQTFAITVELVGDDGNTLLVARPDDAGAFDLDAGITLRSSLTVDARKSCDGATSTSSSGGMGGGSASSSSSGGAGGGDAGDGG